MKGVIVNKDNVWVVISCEEFERDYHIKTKQSENIYVLQHVDNEYYITSYPLVCGLFRDGELFYVDYHPDIIVNGVPVTNLIPDSMTYETSEDIYKYIDERNKKLRENPVIILGWGS